MTSITGLISASNGRQAFDSVDARLDRLELRIDSRFDSMQRTMVQAVIALTGAMLAGFAAMIALIATQL